MIDLTTGKQTHFSFYSDEAIAGRQAERIEGCLLRIHEAADVLSLGLDPNRSPDQLLSIQLALECLRAELDCMADA